MAQFSPASVADDLSILVSVHPTVVCTHSFLLGINRVKQVFAIADPLSPAPFAIFSPAAVQVRRMETRNPVLTVNIIPLLLYFFPCRLIGEKTANGESVGDLRVAVIAFIAIEPEQHELTPNSPQLPTSAANPPAPSHRARENTWPAPDTSEPRPRTLHKPRCGRKHGPPAWCAARKCRRLRRSPS
jgi:hypothetical protein